MILKYLWFIFKKDTYSLYMDIIKAFKLDNTEHPINIQGTIDEPLFQATQIGELLGIKKIRNTIKDFSPQHKCAHTMGSIGGIREVLFLTEKGLYKLLGLSRKPIAATFQDWMVEVIKDIRRTGEYKLNGNLKTDVELQKSGELIKHKTLLQAHDNKRVVYLTKLKNLDDNTSIIKVGWTDCISTRNRQLNNDYGCSVLQNIFECNDNRGLESFIKRHPEIACFAFTEEISNGKRSSETFKLSKTEYDNVVKIINKNIAFYCGFNPEQYIEMEKLKLQQKEVDLKHKITDLVAKDPYNVALIDLLSNKTSSSAINSVVKHMSEESDTDDSVHSFDKNLDDKPRKNTRNRKVQQYNPETFELIYTFDGLMDVIRKLPQLSKIGVKQAALKNHIYNGFRWYFIDREDTDTKHNIPPTEAIISSIPKFIAMLNLDKTMIVNVFSSQKEAASARKLKHNTAINNAINKGTSSSGHYFMLFDNCHEALKNEYLSRAKLPNQYIPKGTKIVQINPMTKEDICTYDSIADVLKHFHMSRASLKRACANNEVHKGFMWKYMDSV